jgi:hypothetical protein
MAKKYLSLEEAASQLGISTDQLKKFREIGDIRGFADRGSWKFREQDIEEFLRSRQTDSSPDFPIISAETSSSSSVLDEPESDDLSSSDSDVRLFFDESMFDDDNDAKELANSGSDVRLSGDSGPKLESDSDEQLNFSPWDSSPKLSDSDSDVKLVGSGTEAELDLALTTNMSDSDSDVLLADDSVFPLSDSDSDVRLSDDDRDDADLGNTTQMMYTGADSDSDVKLMGGDDFLSEDSDSDVMLADDPNRTDSDIRLIEPHDDNSKTIALGVIPEDSDLKLINKGSGVRQSAIDSGISLDVRGSGLGLDADESGISLEIDSGISLEADDSGISLESFDSGANLGGDSGISLESFDSGITLDDDSGISLESDDSGISLDIDDDSGISLQSDDMGRTMPMQSIPGARAALSESNAMTTQFEIPSQSGKDSEFELSGLDDDDEDVGTNTSVLTFEDDEDDDATRTVKAPALSRGVVDDEEEDLDDYADETDGGGLDDEFDDDDEFADDDGDDVHDAEDFGDDDFDSGQSQAGTLAPGVRAAGRPEVDWGVGVKTLIGLSTVLSILCAVMGIELIRTMWLWTQPGTESTPSAVLQMVGGLF